MNLKSYWKIKRKIIKKIENILYDKISNKKLNEIKEVYEKNLKEEKEN